MENTHSLFRPGLFIVINHCSLLLFNTEIFPSPWSMFCDSNSVNYLIF